MNTLINQIVVQEVKAQLSQNAKFMKNECGFLSGECFKDQVIFKSNEMNMSVNEIVKEYLKINGCA